MSKKLSIQMRMASLIKKGKPFIIATDAERRAALSAAQILGISITTVRREPASGFDVRFL